MGKTGKPLATISYNTEKGLRVALHQISPSFWSYIPHKPETQLATPEKKAHFHVYMEFENQVSKSAVRECFIEPSVDGSPALGAMPCNPSKFEDWYLYCKHDRSYLESKNLVRKYTYMHTDFRTSSNDQLTEYVNLIDITKYHSRNYMSIFEDAYNRGVRDFAVILCENCIPIQVFRAWSDAWVQYKTFRATHERNLRLAEDAIYQATQMEIEHRTHT